jgi:propionyl-CoA synthetase
MKKIADGEAWNMPATIDDPAILDEIGEALRGRGVGADEAGPAATARA